MIKTSNIIKVTCKKIGLTYKELGEAIGYSESAINNASRSENVSNSMSKAIELYLKILELEKSLKNFNLLKKIFSEMVKN